jgi:hypothetical protein
MMSNRHRTTTEVQPTAEQAEVLALDESVPHCSTDAIRSDHDGRSEPQCPLSIQPKGSHRIEATAAPMTVKEG